MYKILTSLLAALVLFTSCNNSQKLYEKLGEFTEKFSKEMATEYGLSYNSCTLNPIGGSYPPRGTLQTLGIRFICSQKMGKENARRLLVACTEKLLVRLNKELKPFLRPYPFKSRQLYVEIHFLDADEQFFKDGLIGLCYVKGNEVSFISYSSNDKEKPKSEEESYSTALSLTKGSKPQIDKFLPANISPYQAALGHIKDFAKEIEDTTGLKMINKSLNPRHYPGTQQRVELRGIHVSFNSPKKLDVDNARKLIVELTENLLDRIVADKNIEQQSNPSPLTYGEINLDIAALDDKEQFVSDGSIAVVFLLKGDVVYCCFDPNKKQLEKVLEEPYLTAKKEALMAINRNAL